MRQIPAKRPAVRLNKGGAGGARKQGVPFHIHGAGYSEPIHGRKVWFLTPPDRRPPFDPEETTLTWIRKHLTALADSPGFLQCTVRPRR